MTCHQCWHEGIAIFYKCSEVILYSKHWTVARVYRHLPKSLTSIMQALRLRKQNWSIANRWRKIFPSLTRIWPPHIIVTVTKGPHNQSLNLTDLFWTKWHERNSRCRSVAEYARRNPGIQVYFMVKLHVVGAAPTREFQDVVSLALCPGCSRV